MKQGDLVTLRLEETGNMRLLVPGLIVGKERKDDRTVYHVLARDNVHIVTDNDLGPLDLTLYSKKDVVWEPTIEPV